jgi:hypothetical protein
MSLFNDASLIVTPNGYKAGKLYSIVPSSGAGDLSVTRATTATRVNSAGLIETVGLNVPRLDYTDGSCPSILVEPQRTNLLLNSATVATQTINVTAVAHTISFYGSGTITLSGVHSATVVGTGTTRKTYTFTPTAGNLIITVSGTCTNGQLEAGANATSYIPTTSASVTRNADVVNKTGISSLIGQTEGTIFADFHLSNLIGEAQIVESGTDVNNRIRIRRNINKIECFVVMGGVPQAIIVSASQTIGRHKLAFNYKANDFQVFLDGVASAKDTSGTVPVQSEVSIGTRIGVAVGSDVFNSSIRLIAFYPTMLTSTQCTQLTTL